MEVELVREGGSLFSGRTPGGARIVLGPPADDPRATSPMELVLEALAGCSSVDVLGILAKQRATVTDYRVKVVGVRDQESEFVSPFTDIVLEYEVHTDVSERKVVRAVKLSLEKYCSVAKMLEGSVRIRPAVTVNGRRVLPSAQERDAQE